MPRRETEWAKVEWNFLSLDDRFWLLDADVRFAYLGLWTLCVAKRRDWFAREATLVRELSDCVHIGLPLAARCIAECAACGILSRGPGGAVIVDGVRFKHSKLKGWCDPFGGTELRPPRKNRKEREPPQPPHRGGEPSLRALHTDLRNRIQARGVTKATRSRDGYVFDRVRVNGKKQITLETKEYSRADPLVVGRADIGLYLWE